MRARRVSRRCTRRGVTIDYTFWLNLLMVFLAGWLIWLHRRFLATGMGGEGMEMSGGGRAKRAVAWLAGVVVVGGAGLWLAG